MEEKALTKETEAIAAIKISNHARTQVKESYTFHEMKKSKIWAWELTIAMCFLAWLGLLMFGLSYDSSEYHDKVFGKKSFQVKDTVFVQLQSTLTKGLVNIQALPVLKTYRKPEDPKPTPKNIIIYILSTTPFNVALLAALSALIGGLTSNLSAHNKYAHERNHQFKPDSEALRTYLNMTESPTVAMIRGFIVYLLLVTGAFLTNFTTAIDSNDKFIFAGTSAPSYFKFAVTVTLLSYLVGYDPGRLRNLLHSINLTKWGDASSDDAKDDEQVRQVRFSRSTFKRRKTVN